MSEEMEFRLISPTDDGFIKKIEWNSEEIREKVSQMVSEYKGLVYTEDNIKVAKEDRAYLNKLKTAIDNRRKEVKKLCEAPYKDFEKEVKEVLAIIEEPCALIDEQIKAYEEHEKEEKKQKIALVYSDHIGEYAEMVSFDRLFNPRWLNVSVSLRRASDEMKAAVEKVKSDIDTLKEQIDDSHVAAVTKKYVETLDLSEALRENYRLIEIDKQIEEQRKKQEAEKVSHTEELAQMLGVNPETGEEVEEDASETSQNDDVAVPEEKVEDTPSQPVEAENEDVAKPQTNDTPEEAKGICKFWVKCTRSQLVDLAEYMKAHGIEYGNAK